MNGKNPMTKLSHEMQKKYLTDFNNHLDKNSQ